LLLNHVSGPTLPRTGFENDTFVTETIQANHLTADVPWAPVLSVLISDVYLTPSENEVGIGIALGGPVSPSNVDVSITPVPVPGLPVNYNVLYVSPDLKWFSDGHSLYHVPEPSALVLAGLALLFLLWAGTKREVHLRRMRRM